MKSLYIAITFTVTILAHCIPLCDGNNSSMPSTAASTTATMTVSASISVLPSEDVGIVQPTSTNTVMAASPVPSLFLSASSAVSETGEMFASTSSTKPTVVTSSSIIPSPSSANIVAPSSAAPPANKVFFCNFKVLEMSCTVDIREGNRNHEDYKAATGKILAAVKASFANDPLFIDSSVQRLDCGSIVPQIKIVKNERSSSDPEIALKPLMDKVSANSLVGLNVDIGSFSSASTLAPQASPNIYLILETKLSVKDFCMHQSIFKQELSKRIYVNDGLSTISATQIVFFDAECHLLAGTTLAHPKFYIATNSDVNVPTAELTIRAAKLIRQYIADGTTRHLGVSFAGKITKLTYGGTDQPSDDELSGIAIVLIGFAATVGLLLLVIIIILLLKRRSKGASFDEDKAYRKQQKYEGITMSNVAYTDDVLDATPESSQLTPKAADNPAYQVEEQTEPEVATKPRTISLTVNGKPYGFDSKKDNTIELGDNEEEKQPEETRERKSSSSSSSSSSSLGSKKNEAQEVVLDLPTEEKNDENQPIAADPSTSEEPTPEIVAPLGGGFTMLQIKVDDGSCEVMEVEMDEKVN